MFKKVKFHAFRASMVKILALVSTLSPAAHDAIFKCKLIPTHRMSLKEQCSVVVNKLLNGISYRYPAEVCFDQTLKKKVENFMLKAGLSSETLARIRPYIDSSVNISLTCYAHTSPEVREFVAIYTSYAITVDDLGHEFLDNMKGLVSNLLNGQTIENAVLRGYFDLLRDHGSQFGQFGSDMIAKATVDFVCSCYVELELEKRESNANVKDNHHYTVTAPEFAEYFRIKTGVSEPYAFFAFPEHFAREDEWLHTYLPAITYMVKFFNYANDILSFYKESRADERANYISNQAAAHSISCFESLEMLCKKTIEVFHTIDTILAPNEDLRRKIHQWMHGYLVYHMVSARYRLDELGIPAVLEARKLFFGTN